MKRVLITGAAGFVGSHLAEYLLEKGYEIYGFDRRRASREHIRHIENKMKLIEGDLSDAYSIAKAIKESEPDYIFHLAAQSFVLASWHAPQETMTTNVIGTVNLLEAVRGSRTDARIQIAGSSEEYGKVYENEVPIKETNPFRPLSPYGVSKVASDLLGLQYHESYGLKVVVTRAFNHEGPRRGEQFVTSNFAKQIVEVEKEMREPVIYVGNLNAKRDYTDVRDVVVAYELALQKCDFGEQYNICSGKAWSIKQVLDVLLSLSKVSVSIKQDPSRMRPSDVPILLGDYTKFKEKTGWTPKIPFEKTLEATINYWREKLRS